MLCSNGPFVPIRISLFLRFSVMQIYFGFPNKVHYCNKAVTLPDFSFSIAFSSRLMVLAAVLVTLIGRGSVDITLRAKGLSNLRRLSTCNPVSLYPIFYSLLESLLELSQERFLRCFLTAFSSPLFTSDAMAYVKKSICLSFPPPCFW